MSCTRVAAVIVAGALVATACTGESPVSPSASSAGIGGLDARPPKAPSGSYALSFNVYQGGTLQPVPTLPVLYRELILRAHVTDASGVPATTGSVTFEYCSLNGLPPGDITRADEAPKEACADGSASWDRLGSLPVGTCLGPGSGSACYNFGIVRIPRTVGFRFRFAGQKSNVASGTSEALNFTWE